MATRTVKMSSEESQGGSRSELQKKVTGTVTDTREFLHDVRVEMKQVTWPSRETSGVRALLGHGMQPKIGRASCRERV